MGILSSLITLVAPKKGPSKPTAFTSTYNPLLVGNLLPVPSYQDALTDIMTQRQSLDSRDMLQWLFKYDPDVSAAVNAYLTVADTEPVIYVKDVNGEFDPDGHQTVQQLLAALCGRIDYSTGFQWVVGFKELCERMRYMVLMRGGCATELVLDKNALPLNLNIIDLKTIYWIEDQAGQYVPKQRPITTGQLIDLSKLTTFFLAMYRQDPTAIYTEGAFVSSINTVAARAQVVNDLYRIMQVTGYPRLDITVVEQTLTENAPANIRNDPQQLRNYVNARLTDISNVVSTLRPDQAFAHTDAVSTTMVNDKQPGVGIDVSAVIDVLNAQNQAALKTMATIIGRGDGNSNSASVEARIFSMNADEINVPVAEVLSQVLTYCLLLTGNQSTVQLKFRKAELRSTSELEPQMTLKQARWLELLSLGLVDDVEFSVEFFGRPPLQAAPQLSGTGFMQEAGAESTIGSAQDVSPNADPLGRSIQPAGSKTAKNMTKSNSVKTGPKNG